MCENLYDNVRSRESIEMRSSSENRGETRPTMFGSKQENARPPTLQLVVYGTIIVLLMCLFGMSVYIMVELKKSPPNDSTNPDESTNLHQMTERPLTSNTSSQTDGCSLCNPPISCKALKDSGTTENGYYYIKPSKTHEAFQVYCDMKTDGGGWTLVASVHENDLTQACSQGDNWFNNRSKTGVRQESSNWENTFVFGTAHSAVSSDYKSSAYYLMKADDLMLRHVSNIIEGSTLETTPFLQYQTTDHFLQKYGGNLRDFFSNFYPLKTRDAAYFDHKTILDNLQRRASEVSSLIPNFYQYQYPSGSNIYYLRDGGRKMFTNRGMEMYSYMSGRSNTLYYGKEYTFQDYNMVISSRTSHPFYQMVFIGNYDLHASHKYLRVHGYRPNTDQRTRYTSSIHEGNFGMTYITECRGNTNTTIPNLCDVFYLIKNEKEWGTPHDAGISVSASIQTTYYYYYANRVGTWAHTMLGYTLFASTNEGFIPEPNLKNAMKKILSIVASVDSAPVCSVGNGPAFPISISKGEDILNSTIPPLVTEVTPGYLQFRTYGKSGAVFAMCPGVKIESPGCTSEYVCIGGVLNSTVYDDCNDFANWNGRSTDTPLPIQGNGFSHSVRDIHSTIMIFYR